MKGRGIKHTMSTPYSPQQNGVAERENRIIEEAARSMIYSRSDLPQFLWAEAMNTVAYVINRTGPTKISNKTPYELWYGNPADISKLKVFGTECFALIPEQQRKKLDKKSEKGLLVGYGDNNEGYRVYIPEYKDVIISHDVTFKPEKLSPQNTNIESQKNDVTKTDEMVPEIEDGHYTDENENESEVENCGINDENDSNENQTTSVDGRVLRNRKNLKPTEFFGCPIFYYTETVPENYKQSIESKESDLWSEAMKDELKSLTDQNTWILVEKPENQKVINSKWVFKIKENPNGSLRYKARLIIKGYSQIEGIDYTETFSPVVRFDTFNAVKITQF